MSDYDSPVFTSYKDTKNNCANCGVTETPVWRHGWIVSGGSNGDRANLCNKCGLQFSKGKLTKDGPRVPAPRGPSTPPTARNGPRTKNAAPTRNAAPNTLVDEAKSRLRSREKIRAPGREDASGPLPVPQEISQWIEEIPSEATIKRYQRWVDVLRDYMEEAEAGNEAEEDCLDILNKLLDSPIPLEVLERSGICACLAALVGDESRDVSMAARCAVNKWRTKVESALDYFVT